MQQINKKLIHNLSENTSRVENYKTYFKYKLNLQYISHKLKLELRGNIIIESDLN